MLTVFSWGRRCRLEARGSNFAEVRPAGSESAMEAAKAAGTHHRQGQEACAERDNVSGVGHAEAPDVEDE